MQISYMKILKLYNKNRHKISSRERNVIFYLVPSNAKIDVKEEIVTQTLRIIRYQSSEFFLLLQNYRDKQSPT